MTQPTDGATPDSDRPEQRAYVYPAAADPVGLTEDPHATSSAHEGSSRKGKALLVGGLAAVLVLGVGGAIALQQLSGSGPRPADVMPADTFGYVQLDIDPSAGQKIAAVRFLGKIPEIKSLAEGDARKRLWEFAVDESDDDCLAKFDYDKDVAPWIGDRVGMGLRPGGSDGEPNVLVALQVTDEKAAASALDRLDDCGDAKESMEIRTRDGYVLFTDKGRGDAVISAIDKGVLSQNSTFNDDLNALGEQGVAATWWDLEAVAKQLPTGLAGLVTGRPAPPQVKGRIAAALRFDPSHVELAGIARGLEGTQAVEPLDGSSAELVNLPDDTIAALHLSGMDRMLDQVWPEIKRSLDAAGSSGMDDPVAALENELGLTLPDDLKALLGSSFTLSLPDQDLAASPELPVLGAKAVTSNAKRAEEVITTIEEAAGSAGLLTKVVDGDHVYIATTEDYADRLKAGGKLGDTEGFKAALGDVSDADYAVYVDLDRIEKLYLPQLDGDERAALEAMRSVGLSSTVTGKGEATFSLRVAAN